MLLLAGPTAGAHDSALRDFDAALRLDPSLQSHVVAKGKNVSLTLPLPP